MKNFNDMESEYWKKINQNQIAKEKIQDLTGFKSSEVNYKIAYFNPKTNAIRYFKTFIYNLTSSLTPDAWEKLLKINNRSVGDPITITYNREKVCLDYLFCIFELEFIEKHIKMDGRKVLEIGAGYGRSCHAVLSNYNIESYTIIDLENCLELSQRYLEKVLCKSDFAKISFVKVGEIDLLKNFHFDICLNINSFAEMDPEAVNQYLGYINEKCNVFYVKNPVGKYLDRSLDDHCQGEDVVKLALSMGPLRDIIDIHNNEEVLSQVGKFISAYHPGHKWKCIADSWARPWSFYWQAIFKKVKDKAN